MQTKCKFVFSILPYKKKISSQKGKCLKTNSGFIIFRKVGYHNCRLVTWLKLHFGCEMMSKKHRLHDSIHEIKLTKKRINRLLTVIYILYKYVFTSYAQGTPLELWWIWRWFVMKKNTKKKKKREERLQLKIFADDGCKRFAFKRERCFLTPPTILLVLCYTRIIFFFCFFLE